MTCIVGLVHEARVYIGGDSAAVSGWDLTVRADAKVFKRGPFVMGFTTSFRMGQLLRYRLEIPKRPEGMALDEYMATLFVDASRQCLKDGGQAKRENEVEEGGSFLVGHEGRLFHVAADYQVGEAVDGFTAVGTGADSARGSLFASSLRRPRPRVEQALAAAERFNAAVRGPFTVLSA